MIYYQSKDGLKVEDMGDGDLGITLPSGSANKKQYTLFSSPKDAGELLIGLLKWKLETAGDFADEDIANTLWELEQAR